MIKIKNVSKSFNSRKVLNDISMELPDKGLCFILGQSGCGKTTLLNCIAGLLEFEGTISVNGDVLASLSKNDLDRYRLKNIGFVFQDFKVFLSDSVFNNVALPLQCATSMDASFRERRVEDILELVALSNHKNDIVSTLSGGEMQRVAIARAMINEPRVLLCDEPTGALDSSNKALIMTILKTISATRLVVVVSHDEELARSFADETYILNYGEVIKAVHKRGRKPKRYLPIYNKDVRYKPTKIPFSFLFTHTKNCIKQRKFRSIIINLIVSFGLLGSGMAFMLSDTIYETVVSTYSNIVADNQIIVSMKSPSKKPKEIIAAKFEKVDKIYKENIDYFDGIGATYYCDFENNFKTKNQLCLASSTYRHPISGYSVRNINNFIWLNQCESEIFPAPIEELREDEIILSLNRQNIREICYEFRIPKTIESLSQYLLKNDVFLCFDLANEEWQYDDQQILKLKGFVLDNIPTIYHSNPLWNEYMFETMMRYPNNNNFTMIERYPWTMKKSYYLMLKDDSESFIRKSLNNDKLNDYIFEIASRQYYPNLFDDKKSLLTKRLLVFDNVFETIPAYEWKYMKTLQKSIKNPIYATNSGYSVYGSSVLSGFVNVYFLSSKKDDVEAILDEFSKANMDLNAHISLPKNILKGHYSNTSDKGVFYKGLDGEKIKGEIPKNLKEIAISRGVANALFPNENPVGKILYNTVTFDTFNPGTNQHKITYEIDELVVTGLVENDKNILYQDELWSLAYFQCNLGISRFQLLPFGMSFEIDDKSDSQTVINSLEKEFENYTFLNPMIDIEKQADQMCYYMQIILAILSLITLSIAICLVSICNNLHVLEIKKDVGLIRCLGVNEKESKKLLYFHSFFISTLGALTTILELGLFYLLIKFGIGDKLGIPLSTHFSIIPYIIVMGLSLIIGLLPALFTANKLKKVDPLEAIN